MVKHKTATVEIADIQAILAYGEDTQSYQEARYAIERAIKRSEETDVYTVNINTQFLK